MKKLVVLFACMFLLLLGGGRYTNAGIYQLPSSPSHGLEKKHRVKFTSQDSSNTLIEDVGLDTGEDLSGGGLGDEVSNKLFIKNYSFLDSWYLALSCRSLLSHCQVNFKIFAPFCGQSNPIYIIHRVLRL